MNINTWTGRWGWKQFRLCLNEPFWRVITHFAESAFNSGLFFFISLFSRDLRYLHTYREWKPLSLDAGAIQGRAGGRFQWLPPFALLSEWCRRRDSTAGWYYCCLSALNQLPAHRSHSPLSTIIVWSADGTFLPFLNIITEQRYVATSEVMRYLSSFSLPILLQRKQSRKTERPLNRAPDDSYATEREWKLAPCAREVDISSLINLQNDCKVMRASEWVRRRTTKELRENYQRGRGKKDGELIKIRAELWGAFYSARGGSEGGAMTRRTVPLMEKDA